MAGFGGLPKLSTQQQDDALSALMPVLISGTRALEQWQKQSQEDECTEVAGLLARLALCVSEIQSLMSEVEMAHSRTSTLDKDELEFMIDIHKQEVQTLSVQLRAALTLSRSRRGR
jgi:hypothetical protein